MTRKYLYENYLGGFYTTNHGLSYDECYCDFFLGTFETLEELKALLKDYELSNEYIEKFYRRLEV